MISGTVGDPLPNEPAPLEVSSHLRRCIGITLMSALAMAFIASPDLLVADPGPASLEGDPLGPGGWSDVTIEELEAAATLRLSRARAHDRIEWIASPVPSGVPADCPVSVPLLKPSKETPWRFVPRSAVRQTAWRGVASASESAPSLFAEYISEQVVQSRCINCHVEGGVSGHTRLVLLPATVSDHAKRNLETFQGFVEAVEGGADRILSKIQGVGHGGGVQVPAGSAEFANMERFMRLLDGTVLEPVISPETLFDGVTMGRPEKILRRAALIFAGRLPTRAEIGAVSDGRISSLRRTVRNLMRGPGFHDFLIRASNDRLLTDRHLDNRVFEIDENQFFVALADAHLTRAKAAIDRGYPSVRSDPAYREWSRALQFGLARAPLELIAHVVESDRPYTEILTADYIMANPAVAEAYGASTRFDDPSDPDEFKPSRIVSYYRNDDSKVVLRVEDGPFRARRIVNPGNLSTDYPHAGLLNTTVFLARYPTTATNRNRARSRWTYYHFLAVDIEKSASRTTDAAALADTNNPTMNNPACTVCHQVMDPVAGAFQNYGEEGLYRDERGGMDSLARLYKFPRDGSESPYQRGDTWYRDMRAPGFGQRHAPDPGNSLQWLAREIVADPRFAEATVRFWWPGILGNEVSVPPEDSSDSDYAGQLLASQAQAAEVTRLAEAFRAGIAGGRPFNAKDLFAEIVLSPWFRAETLAVEDPVRESALRHAGVERLLTPEELERKTEAISGFVWGRQPSQWVGGGRSHLDAAITRESRYKLVYGGMDSDGVPTRARESTPLMAAVAQSHAVEVSCPIVAREFYLWPEPQRRLFRGIGLDDSPATPAGSAAIKRKLAELQGKLFGVTATVGSPDVEEAYQLFVEVWSRKRKTEGDRFPGSVQCRFEGDRLYFEGIADDVLNYDKWGWAGWNRERARALEPRDEPDPHHVARTWVVTLAFLLSDYRYLYF